MNHHQSVFLAGFVLFLSLQVKVIDLKELRWNYRVICIESHDPDLINKQIDEFRHKTSEFNERKLRFFIKNKEGFFEWPSKLALEKIHNFPQNKNHSFSITLIGLDGGQKFQSFTPTSSNNIFDLIDSMPMRQSEKNE